MTTSKFIKRIIGIILCLVIIPTLATIACAIDDSVKTSSAEIFWTTMVVQFLLIGVAIVVLAFILAIGWLFDINE